MQVSKQRASYFLVFEVCSLTEVKLGVVQLVLDQRQVLLQQQPLMHNDGINSDSPTSRPERRYRR